MSSLAWPLTALLVALSGFAGVEHYRAEARAAELEAEQARAVADKWRSAAAQQTRDVEAWKATAIEAQGALAGALERARQAAAPKRREAERVEAIAAAPEPAAASCDVAWAAIESMPGRPQ